ncbi:MAG: GNAT family N-acetyltransferase [Bacilli bacterium]
MGEVFVREATIEDLVRIREIYNFAVTETAYTFDIYEKSEQAMLEWFQRYGGRYPLIVATIDDDVCGYACLSPFRPRDGYYYTAETSVYVDPTYHSRGIASTLVDGLLKRSKEIGFHTIIACITEGNDISVKLHQKFGFDYVGCFRHLGRKFDQWQNAHFYQKIID